MVQLDFLNSPDNGLLIQDGDFKIDDAEYQHAQNILMLVPGEIRYEPLLGANFSKFIGSNIDDATLHTIAAEELLKDGIILDSLNITRDRNMLNIDLILR